MTAPNTQIHQWYAVVRDVDVTEISGTGVVAWVLKLPHGSLMWWDTVIKDEPTETLEWYDVERKFHNIHGHDGCTRLVPVENAHAQRGRELMWNKLGDVMHTLSELFAVIEHV